MSDNTAKCMGCGNIVELGSDHDCIGDKCQDCSTLRARIAALEKAVTAARKLYKYVSLANMEVLRDALAALDSTGEGKP